MKTNKKQKKNWKGKSVEYEIKNRKEMEEYNCILKT